ncbi:MAG: Spo0B domain-containing protein [Desulfocucumaceae bacterium]
MDTATFLEMMSVQRHDLLNHFQVISGLVQLNKTERVREYINQVSLEVEKLGKAGHIVITEVAAVLLVGHFLAGKHQVEVIYDINTDLKGCLIPGEVLGQVIKEVFEQSLECLVPPGVPNRCLRISLHESEKNFLFKIFCPEPDKNAGRAQTRLAGTEKKLAPYGGKLGIVISAGGGEICILFPRKMPEENIS